MKNIIEKQSSPFFFMLFLHIVGEPKPFSFYKGGHGSGLTGSNLLKFQITFPFRSTSSKVSLYLEQDSKESSSSI